MKIAITGATGFIGRYIVRRCLEQGHACRLWYRSDESRLGMEGLDVEWIRGELNDDESTRALVNGCDAVIHSGLFREGAGFRGAEGNVVQFAELNILGSLRLIEAAVENEVPRFVFISTCAVHEKILDDRPLDESHPLWPLTHYGAHKAAIEKFVHSYGLGSGYPICALRPTGVYGLNYPTALSKWYELVKDVVDGKPVECQGGGKEVHAADVAKASEILVQADGEQIRGEAFSCYDRYISRFEVAELAKQLSGSDSAISGQAKSPKHQIETRKIRRLGMEFGGEPLLQATIGQMVNDLRSNG